MAVVKELLKAITPVPIIIEVEAEEAEMDQMEEEIPARMINLSANYVVNLFILFKYVIIDLVLYFKEDRLKIFNHLEIKVLFLPWLLKLTLL